MDRRNLLEVELPTATLSPEVGTEVFFDRCEEIARSVGWETERGRNYGGPGYDLLNVHVRRDEADPLKLRMVVTPQDAKVEADVVSGWSGGFPAYDEYVSVLRTAFKPLLDQYSEKYGQNLRLGLPRRPKILDWDRSDVNCARLGYARDKLRTALRDMATAPGEVRERLKSAFMIIHVVRPDDLPAPLRPHLSWIYDQLTCRPARYEGEGTLDATLAQMRRSTGTKIAERLQDLLDALEDLCPSEF